MRSTQKKKEKKKAWWKMSKHTKGQCKHFWIVKKDYSGEICMKCGKRKDYNYET